MDAVRRLEIIEKLNDKSRVSENGQWVIPYEINQEKAKMFLTPSDFDKIWHTYWDYYEFQKYSKF